MRGKSTMNRVAYEFQCRRDYATAESTGRRRQNDHIAVERLVRSGVNRRIAEHYIVYCRKKSAQRNGNSN